MVILNKEFYHLHLLEMLADEDTYTRLAEDPTVSNRGDLVNLVDYGYDKRVLTNEEKQYLVPS